MNDASSEHREHECQINFVMYFHDDQIINY